MRITFIRKNLLQYRIGVLNYFHRRLKIEGKELHSISGMLQKDNGDVISFENRLTNYKFKDLRRAVIMCAPEVVVLSPHLKNLSEILLMVWLKIKKIPFIIWVHGINLQDPKNKYKNYIYHLMHDIADAIVIYSKNQKKYIRSRNHPKTFVANNTLNFEDYPRVNETKELLKKKHSIPFERVVVFVGRIQKRKRLEDLIAVFESEIDGRYGLIIVGPGMTKDLGERINKKKNILYKGPIYNKTKIAELFKLSDLFCIPGTNGLGLNEAMHWGLPVIAEDVLHSPEIMYLKEGVNGFVVPKGDIGALKEKIELLLENDELYRRFSRNAKQVMNVEGSIERMYAGFFEAVGFVLKTHGAAECHL